MTNEFAKKSPVKVALDTEAIEQEIRARAYQLYEERGRVEGYDLDDWFTAEDEVIRRKVTTLAA